MNSSDSILENTISYLHKISEALPPNLSIPKSYYASKSRILELKAQSCLPSKLTGNKIRCPRCCLNFSDYPPNVRLMPKRTKDRFTKKILRKVEQDEPLTIFQENSKNIIRKRTFNNVLLRTCQFCKREIKTNIQFKDDQTKKPKIVETPIIPQKKKKKKKDKFAGLTPSAVMSFNESTKNSEQAPPTKNLNQILRDEKLKEDENQIKYNVVGVIENKKDKKKKNKKKLKAEDKVPVKTTKTKIQEKKEKIALKKQEKKLKNLLSTLNKPKASNILNGFLHSL